LAEFFDSSSSEKNPFEELAVVYILYFDEAQGHIPLLIYPTDKYKDDKEYMRPIKYHPIWFLSVEEQDALDHIDLEFKGYTFFGKKFFTQSKRKKRRAGLEEETPETIVIIVSLPNDIEIFGDDLIRLLTNRIKHKFEDQIFEIIESEILKDQIIKTPKDKEIIKKGKAIKEKLRELIEGINNHFFQKVVRQSDTASIKKQKAISYLSLKGLDVSHIATEDYKNSFSSIKLFDPMKKTQVDFDEKEPFSIIDVHKMGDSQELEILVQNNTEQELHNLTITITHVKEYFEKEVMEQFIDFWFPNEELLFISPIIPTINEYIFFIIKEKNKERLLSKRIDLDIINNNN